MQRLAFIRLLVGQAVDQSHLPEPLSASCILTYHDAVELFLILASEHLKVGVAERGKLTQRFFDGLHPDKLGPAGVDLAGKKGVDRLSALRNTIKHDAALPATRQVEQSRNDAELFFEENTPRVFGLSFDAIDMIELVPQQSVRTRLRDADSAWTSGDLVKSMGELRVAFDELFFDHMVGSHYRESPLTFGPQLRSDSFLGSKIAKALTLDASGKHAPVPAPLAESVGKHLETVTDVVSRLQRALQIASIGIDYHRLHRFEMLCPHVSLKADGHREAYWHGPYTPEQSDYDYCRQFLITAALRVAEMTSLLEPPTWRR
ncbi:hypothetical protein AB0C91_24355 [Streptomyces sp. NPDC048674]|uniref:hypothetical protein n=1 Tax=Streptomyces sp. NPDC048674 TaxID=3155491 RepID=UPI00342B57CB